MKDRKPGKTRGSGSIHRTLGALSRAGRHGEAGFLLIITLWVVIIVAVVTLTYTFQARTEVWMARYSFDSTRARYAAKTGVARAMILLREDVLKDMDVLDKRTKLIRIDDKDKGYRYDGTNEEWFTGGEVGYRNILIEANVDRIQVPVGSYTVKVIDESSRINLNHPRMLQEVFEGLLYATGFDNKDAIKAIAALIIDWRDADDRPSDAGDKEKWGDGDSEDTFWNPHIDTRDIRDRTNSEFFACKNGPFGCVEEVLILLEHLENIGVIEKGMALLLFHGGDPEEVGKERNVYRDYSRPEGKNMLLGIRDYLTVDSPGPVNINTASQVVLEALLRSFLDERASRELAERIVDYRNGPDRTPGTRDDRVMRTPDGVDETKESFREVRGMEETVFNQMRPLTTIQSDVFTIISTGCYPAAEDAVSSNRYRFRRDDGKTEYKDANSVLETIRVTVYREFVERILLDREKERKGGREVDSSEELDDPRDDDPARIYVIRYREESVL